MARSLPRPNAKPREVRLHRGDVVVTGPRGAVSGQADVRVVWVPEPAVAFTLTGGADLILATLDGGSPTPATLKLDLGRRGSVIGQPYEWVFPGGGRGATTGTVVRGRVEPASIGRPASIAQVSFGVVNLAALRSNVELAAGGWRIHLGSIPRRNPNWPQTGYHMTHEGVVEREDGQPFTAADSSHVIEGLTYLGAFVEGGWPGIVRPVGRSPGGRVIWQSWEAAGGDELSSHRQWLPHDGPGVAFEAAWYGFWQRWETAEGQSAIRALVPIYVEAARVKTAEAGLVLDQVGLELLSWIVVVEERRMLSGDGHDKLTAADRLRLLMSPVGIDLSISPALPDLAKAARRGTPWEDGVHAVTEIRNSVAHPRKRKALGVPDAAMTQAGMLAHSYFLRSLLAYFGFKGRYSNRAERRVSETP